MIRIKYYRWVKLFLLLYTLKISEVIEFGVYTLYELLSFHFPSSGDLYWNPDRTFAPVAAQDDFCPDKPSPDIALNWAHRFTQALLKDP